MPLAALFWKESFTRTYVDGPSMSPLNSGGHTDKSPFVPVRKPSCRVSRTVAPMAVAAKEAPCAVRHSRVHDLLVRLEKSQHINEAADIVGDASIKNITAEGNRP